MGCGCNKNKNAEKETKEKGFLGTVIEAAKKQPDKLRWFKNGVTGVIRAIGEPSDLTDEQIKERRDICRECPHSTKKDNKLVTTSQCKECGCSILLKSMLSTEKCPKDKWQPITLSINGE